MCVALGRFLTIKNNFHQQTGLAPINKCFIIYIDRVLNLDSSMLKMKTMLEIKLRVASGVFED